jgi:hypothetical protein
MLVVVKKYVVAVAQLVERRIVIPVVEGSIPFSHPTYFHPLLITSSEPINTFCIVLYFYCYFISLLFFFVYLILLALFLEIKALRVHSLTNNNIYLQLITNVLYGHY